jgi:hypothetical protein
VRALPWVAIGKVFAECLWGFAECLGHSANKMSPVVKGLFLSQAKYAAEILVQGNTSSCNPCQTPLEVHSKLYAQDGPPVADPTIYIVVMLVPYNILHSRGQILLISFNKFACICMTP